MTDLSIRSVRVQHFQCFHYYNIYQCHCYYHTGPLSSVRGLSYSFINSSTVNITWSPPFTLPDTNIIGYNISVAINGSNSDSLFTMESYYEFILTSVTDSPCDQISITVAGYNGLDGDTNTLPVVYLPTGNSVVYILIMLLVICYSS